MLTLACLPTPTPKSRFTFGRVDADEASRSPDLYVSRYYDNKRSAKRKEFKTIEAADKVCMILMDNQDEDVCANLHFKMMFCFYIIQGHEVSREKNPENTERGPDGDHHPESPESLLVSLQRKHLSGQKCSFSPLFLPRLTGSRSSCGSSVQKTTWSSLEGISSRTR